MKDSKTLLDILKCNDGIHPISCKVTIFYGTRQ